MEFVRLDERQLAASASLRRLPEAAQWRDGVLKRALNELDATIRKAPVDKVQLLQGYARAIADVIDLLETRGSPSQSAGRRSD